MTKEPAIILSLSKFKKRKKREDKEQRSSENRIIYGQTKSQKKHIKATEQKKAEALSHLKLDPKDKK